MQAQQGAKISAHTFERGIYLWLPAAVPLQVCRMLLVHGAQADEDGSMALTVAASGAWRMHGRRMAGAWQVRGRCQADACTSLGQGALVYCCLRAQLLSAGPR